jgi:transcriptional regulator with PAS, ATPase and Fis domain
VEVNCAALADNLLESELFGHDKGSFTNATSAKPGLIESADGGTLLLDEIGEIPLATQAKLLRVLEDQQVRRVGAIKARTIDVRFIAATNADLEKQIALGLFRSDLFYRLNGVAIVVPPLRERIADIEPLARAFIERACPAGRRVPVLAPETLALLLSYRWPGNVRELRQMIDRALLLCGDGPIRPEHLPTEQMRPRSETPTIRTPDVWTRSGDRTVPPAKGSPEEHQSILDALAGGGGNQTLAARLLGLSRRTLVSRLTDYNVERPRKDKKRSE